MFREVIKYIKETNKNPTLFLIKLEENIIVIIIKLNPIINN